MAKLQKFVVVLLVLTIVLSAVSVIFNLMIYKMGSENTKVLRQSYSTNSGNIGLTVESSSVSSGSSGG